MSGVETWKPVDGWPYEVSDCGNVRRAAGGSNGTKIGRHLVPKTDGDGYQIVRLSSGGKVADFKVHRLVCASFNGLPTSSDLECRHLNGEPSDNVPSNLAWGTSKENAEDRGRHGRHARGEKSPRAKVTDAQAMEIIKRCADARKGRQRVPRGFMQQLATEYGLTVNGLASIAAGRRHFD